MKQFLTLAMAAFLVVSSTGLVLAKKPVLTGDGSEPGEMAAAAAMAGPCFVDVPPINCPLDADLDNIVLWDTSKGAQPWLNVNHCGLTKDLQASGYNVRYGSISHWTSPAAGACVDYLAITSLEGPPPLNCLITPYTDAELTEIERRVREDGLRLFLLNEWGSAPTLTCGAGTAPIAAALGAEWDYTYDFTQAFTAGSHYVGPASLFNGVASWEVSRATSYKEPTDGVVVINSSYGDPAMIAKTYGAGCAVIAGDTDWAKDWLIDSLDNRVLARNAFDYLEFCGQLAPNPSRWIKGRGNIKSPVPAAAAATPPGEASFAIVAKYKKVLTALEGDVSFADEAAYDGAGLTFESTSVTRLATGGNQAKFEGTGTINGAGSYTFIIWTSDGDPDTFRIKIVDAVTLEEEYDTGIQALTKGGIAMHGKE